MSDLVQSTLTAADHLTARSRRIAPSAAVDLVEVAGASGTLFDHEAGGLAGIGVAARIELPGEMTPPEAGAFVTDSLARIAYDDDPGVAGVGPVAIGALNFDPSRGASLVVPRTVVRRGRDGSVWVTEVTAVDDDVSRSASEWPTDGRSPARPPDSFELTSVIPHEEFCRLVENAVDEIGRGRFQKVVLAREVSVEANRPILIPDVLARLHALYPSCMLFSVDGFLGASPELLVARSGRQVRSHPLAGTYPRSGDPAADDRLAIELAQSDKDLREHAFVIDAVSEALSRVCEEVDVPPSPEILPLRNVLHLGTHIRGRLREQTASALELALRLHPTPAIAGTPTREAVEYIKAVEGFDRGRYAGPVGWVDRHGDGEWAIGIRSAEISGARARLFAGVGLVRGSDPERELAETQLKLQALLAALVRP